MREYKTININEWRKTGEGSISDSYVKCDNDDLMLKIFKKNATEQTAKNDYDMAAKVASMGISTAAVYEIVIVDGKFGVIYQNIKNKKSYSRMVVDNPEDMRKYARDFAARAKELHTTPCNTELFESRMDEIRKGIDKARFIGKYKSRLYKMVDELDGPTTCLHGDLNTGNLINAEDTDYWIDFDRFSYGNPIFDIAHMYNIYVCCSHMKLIQNITHMTQEQLHEFWYFFVEEYYGYKGAEIDAFCEYLEIYNALELLYNNYRKTGLRPILITLILIKPRLKKYFND